MRKIFAFLLAVAFCFGFIACNAKTVITEESIVGVWVTPVEAQNLNRYTEYRFEGNGKGSYRIYQDGEGSERVEFGYKLTDTVLTLTTDGKSVEYNTEYDGEELVISRNSESVSLSRR